MIAWPERIKRAFGNWKGARIYRPWRPEVDACVILPGAIRLIEAKIQKFMDGVSKLPIYASLVSTTPELAPYKERKVEMILLMPELVEWVQVAAKNMGISVYADAPQEILDVYNERDKYWTKEAIRKREKRKAKLKELGY